MQKLLLRSCVHLVLLLLLQSATVDAEEQVRSILACPELRGSRVCAVDGAVGLSYNDGCNRVRCLGNDRVLSSRRGCPRPDSAAERRHCRALAHEVLLGRLGPFECANVQPASVCADRPAMFHFSDGCNGVTCDGAGNVASSTRRACPAGDPAGAYCQLVADSIDDAGNADTGPASGERRRRSQQEYSCPNLAPSVICELSTNVFYYWDGCHSIRCHGSDPGQLSLKFCPVPEESDQVGQAYCQQAEREMRAKMERASLHSECPVAPEAVCQGPEVHKITYYTGCNRCRCMAAGESTCTRRSCRKWQLTDEEFADYCRAYGVDAL